ncbi:feruloyl-CoA synthetase [Bradyrhizobium macuxiense]|uniref:Feruloyl-CoA synthetase n=1 Tax=Bradyrhizobium macuxiense TaxID=1755647 RepID=A0A109JGN9_9BRAD|nr:feruloyl-CoA synthase [Bradyrhizobium macuxiense]KWV48490.1 feruloyl-CoA synthetase [Bradyrhizobium macuxiense]
MPTYIPHDVAREDRPDGTILLRSRVPLGPVVRNTGAWLHQWAGAAPDRVFVAERSGEGWRELRYGELLQQVRALASSLLARGLGPEKPIAIISGNGVDHAILALAAQYIGAPIVPLAEQYSLVPDAYPRLQYAIETVRPAMVFAEDGGAYGGALALPFMNSVERVVTRNATGGATTFGDLLKGDKSVDLNAAHAAVGPDTLAKIIFTSGSTANPKGVLTTHGMLCVNQAQMAAAMPVISARPPKIVDWLPWNHVFGGSHNFNMMLANGGSLYIDEGKPTKAGFAASIRNIRDHTCNLAFNVPIGFAQLVAAMEKDESLKRAYLGDCDLIFYAAASVTQDIWSALAKFAKEVRGEVPLMFSGWGMSETAPSATQTHQSVDRPGNIGVPLPAVTAKLIPGEEGRYELRVSGPNVLKGYFHEPDKTKEAFDEDGFLITNDAVTFIDPEDANAGLRYDGRISEDFKLMSGTWVRATNVRLDALKHFADVALDVVVTGQDRNELGLLIFPHPGSINDAVLNSGDIGGALSAEAVRGLIQPRLAAMANHATSSSTRVVRALMLANPPSMSEGELTAKGSINARKILTHRQALVERLYDDDDPAVVRL